MLKRDTKWFIENALKIHGDKYDYSILEYNGWDKKVKIICKLHGVFEQKATNHINRYGCDKCARDKKKLSKREFLKKSLEIHGDKYDYSKIEYIDSKKKITIICKEHGEFIQSPYIHLRGSGCRKCSGNHIKTNNEFKEKSVEIHGDKYDYSKVNYINNITNVKIICEKHGEFDQLPISHLSGSGCPKCKNSKSEWKIEKLLIENNIEYETQKRFKDCRDKLPLPFDFYLIEKNTCIEFDGIHHFKHMKHWGKEHYKNRIRKDEIKNNYCIDKKIKLIRIKYDEDIIERLKNEKII